MSFSKRLFVSGADSSILQTILPYSFGFFYLDSSEEERNALENNFNSLMNQAITYNEDKNEKNQKILESFSQIDQEISEFFSKDSPPFKLLTILLKTYCIYNPKDGYLHGMANILLPLVLLYFPDLNFENSEHFLPLIFWSFTAMLFNTEHIKILQNPEENCQKISEKIRNIIENTAPLTFLWLKLNGIQDLTFLFNDFIYLFSNSLQKQTELLIQVWIMFNRSPSPQNWIVYFSAAILLKLFDKFCQYNPTLLRQILPKLISEIKLEEISRLSLYLYEKSPPMFGNFSKLPKKISESPDTGDDTQLDPTKASTYIIPTHYDRDLRRSNPNQIGFMFTPLPKGIIAPPQARMPGDNIPRCGYCAAFVNKYTVFDKKGFCCNICGSNNILDTKVDLNSVELNYEVYDSYLQNKYLIRKSFIPTEFTIISMSLFKKFPYILDDLLKCYRKVANNRQIGLAIINGGLTCLLFRPSLSIQTFPDEIPEIPLYQIFTGIPYFTQTFSVIKEKIYNLPQIHSNNGAENVIKFAFQIGSRYGSSVKLFFDEQDYNIINNHKTYKDICMPVTESCCEISFQVFPNDVSPLEIDENPSPKISSQNLNGKIPNFTSETINDIFPSETENKPVLDYKTEEEETNNLSKSKTLVEIAAITGGTFSILRKPDFEYINSYTLHDSFIYAKGPGGTGLTDYAGEGFLKNAKGICCAKIGVNQTFFLTYPAKNMTTKYLQIALFYTTEVCSRKVRVFNLKLDNNCQYNEGVIDKYVCAMVSNSLIVESKESAEKLYNEYKNKFKDVNLFLTENLLKTKSPEIYEKAISYRDGYTLHAKADPLSDEIVSV
ncbi:hypothetical protein TVAG_071310 [Trichomonas vaginalis G3]|uniref:Rab-GAP TBC domain-containing protein n=1 Tax=Trichomonas vaginalis (strain ATCC PRA-98 / G3) TaxID=412133 RepID=A2D834_TRIV3|nr:SEC24-related protein family [Trichomonas vaginalis G3]EAY23467.1 hypothetical protein TVAG_071310 [Trichomonas vaginalis G3]KAI5493884.1 SEC24-related protein family [Trichomonas vaginalis G3]|eukprot:XP_001584453.1 hypothetical protein [Trichomonas vaginalis G3]